MDIQWRSVGGMVVGRLVSGWNETRRRRVRKWRPVHLDQRRRCVGIQQPSRLRLVFSRVLRRRNQAGCRDRWGPVQGTDFHFYKFWRDLAAGECSEQFLAVRCQFGRWHAPDSGVYNVLVHNDQFRTQLDFEWHAFSYLEHDRVFGRRNEIGGSSYYRRYSSASPFQRFRRDLGDQWGSDFPSERCRLFRGRS